MKILINLGCKTLRENEMIVEMKNDVEKKSKDDLLSEYLAKTEKTTSTNKLIINTANSNLVIALEKNGEIFYKNEESVKKHNERILSLINEVLMENHLTIKDIDEFGVVVGPGSFTGVRVGIATIKAFKDVTGGVAKSINNLALLYEMCKDKGIKFVAIEGSLNSYFVGEYINGIFYTYPRNLTEEELKNLAKNEKVGCYQISENMKTSDIVFEKVEYSVDAMIKAHNDSNDYSLTPIYYQLSQAEKEKLDKKQIDIIQLNNSHLSDIAILEISNFDRNITGDEPWSRETINSLINNKNLISYVAVSSDELLGYIVGEVSDEINISRVAVKENCRNRGIATALIQKLECDARDKKMNLSLEVCEHNITAYKLYTKLGFELRRKRKNYYKDGSDCLEMIKILN